MTTEGMIKVTFKHPRSAEGFPVELGPETTGQEALDGLLAEKFLEPVAGNRAYVLQNQRTSKSIPLSATFADAGVKDGDTVMVTLTNVGAGE